MKDTPGKPAPVTGATLDETDQERPKAQLDAHVREIVRWHFSPDTGTPFWLEKAKTFTFNPLKDVNGWDDMKKFPHLRGRLAPRRAGAAVGAEGATPTAPCTSSRPAAPPACRRAAS